MRVCGIQIGREPVPAADVLQAQPDQRKESGDDQEKLDHFVVDGAGQSAQQDVSQNHQRRNHQGEVKYPGLRQAQPGKRRVENVQDLNQLRHGIHGNAGRKKSHDGERNGVEAAGLFVKAQAEIFRHRACPRAVIERHHEHAHEDHRRNGADPVKMAGGDAVLRARGAHANHFLRAQVGGKKGQSGNPGGNGAPGQKEIRAGLYIALEDRSDSEHEDEIHDHDGPIDGPQHE